METDNFVITKIEMQKNKQDRVNIFVNEEFFCAMQNFVCVKNGLKVGLATTPEHLQKLTFESDKEKALNKASILLSKGLKTEKQIIDYLLKKGYDPLIANFVVDKLKEYSYVDDNLYVKSYIETYKRKYGKVKMKFELKNKGINEETINKLLNAFETNPDELLVIANKYLKGKTWDYKVQQKLYSHLASKGFSFDEISSTINLIKKNNIVNS